MQIAALCCVAFGFAAGICITSVVWMRSILNRLRRQGVLEHRIKYDIGIVSREEVVAAAPNLRRVASVGILAGLVTVILPIASLLLLTQLSD